MNFETVDENLFKFNHPFTCIVSGPTKIGKTRWVMELLTHSSSVIIPPPQKIYWVYSEFQPIYAEMAQKIPNLILVQGMIELNELKNSNEIPKLIVFDDLMSELSKNTALNELFTRGSHHWNLSCIFIVQNLYFNGMRSARLNTHYLVLFRSPDKSQISCFSRQLYPGKSKIMLSAYNDCTTQKYSPLIVDMTSDCPENMRLKSNYFGEKEKIIYKTSL